MEYEYINNNEKFIKYREKYEKIIYKNYEIIAENDLFIIKYQNSEDYGIIDVDNLKINVEGVHNLKNIMFALLVINILKLDVSKTINSISNFGPLEHRMEYVGTIKNIKFYNDVIATIPEATIKAIETIGDVDTLIFGGQDRVIDYSKLIKYLKKSSVKNFICMPTIGTKI